MNYCRHSIIALMCVMWSCMSSAEDLSAKLASETSEQQETLQRKYPYSFLFVNRGELQEADRYVSVGTVVDGTIKVNQLIKVGRLGHYRVVAKPNKYDLWIHASTGGNLLCIDQADPLVTEIVGNAERILAVTEAGIYFGSERPRNAREIGKSQLSCLNLKTHEISTVNTHRELGRFEWRTAVMSPDGKFLATVKTDPRGMAPTGSPPRFDVLVETIAGTKVVSMGSFPPIPRSPYSSNFWDGNLLWVGANRLVVASGAEKEMSAYVFTLLDTGSGKRITSKSISPRTLALSLTLAKNTRRGLPYVCYGPGGPWEAFVFDADLSRIEEHKKPEGQSWRIHWLREERGWVEPEQEMLLVSHGAMQYELQPDLGTMHTDDATEAYRVAHSMPSADGKLTYLVLMGLDYGYRGGAILDLRRGTLIKDISYYPICWLDGPLLDLERWGP